jgi:hypothetical protein
MGKLDFLAELKFKESRVDHWEKFGEVLEPEGVEL